MNKSEILKNAWKLVKSSDNYTISEALKIAWANAKAASVEPAGAPETTKKKVDCQHLFVQKR